MKIHFDRILSVTINPDYQRVEVEFSIDDKHWVNFTFDDLRHIERLADALKEAAETARTMSYPN